MRFMLDTNVFDLIVADAPLAEAVRDAAVAGRITLVTTHIQEDQIAAIRDDEKREAILRIPRSVEPTTGFALDVSRLGMAGLADEETSATIERIGQRHLTNVPDWCVSAGRWAIPALLCKQGVGGSSPLVSTDETQPGLVHRDDVVEVRFPPA